MSTRSARAGSATKEPRRYDSRLRQRQAEETRRAVLDAATESFSERGWSVGMRELAARAGVSVETVYANFGSKADLLNLVLDMAVVGDEQPLALRERPEFAALGRGSRRQRAAAAARLLTAINERTCGVQRALREAAAVDADLAERLEEMRRRQRRDAAAGTAMVAGRELTAAESDGLWAVISAEVYELLTGTAGWSPAQYEQWLADAIMRLVQPKK